MDSIYWLIAFIVLLIIEVATLCLATIWFAGGALLAFLLALLGVTVEIQLIVFVVVSFALLLSTRALAARYLNQRTVKTNVDSLIGKQARVTESLKGTLDSGVVVINGQEWSAKLESDSKDCFVGEMVTITGIRGVTLQVKHTQEDG